MAGFCLCIALSVSGHCSCGGAFGLLNALSAFVNEGQLEALALGEGDHGLLGVTDGENVGHAGGEVLTLRILNVSDFVGTGVVFDVLEHTDATNVVSAGDEDDGVVLKLDDALDFVGLEVKLPKGINYN